MKKTLALVILLSVLVAAGCSSGEPSGNIAPPDVKVEKAGSGTGPQPSMGAAPPATQPGAAKPSTE